MSYICQKGCGQPLMTETAREIHEENCNGGTEEHDTETGD